MEHEVKQGECIASLAKQYGFLQKTLWNHPRNAKLKSLRQDKNVLLPGDIIYIPDKELKEADKPTEELHRFVLKGEQSRLNLRLLREDEPRANLAYVLAIAGQLKRGQTDGDGWIRTEISGDAQGGKLTLLPKQGKAEENYLCLGFLNPVEEMSGVQARLSNLGYYRGEIDGQASAAVEAALRGFQRDRQLAESGQADAETKQALKDAHGS